LSRGTAALANQRRRNAHGATLELPERLLAEEEIRRVVCPAAGEADMAHEDAIVAGSYAALRIVIMPAMSFD
jgi:hypothetical protein